MKKSFLLILLSLLFSPLQAQQDLVIANGTIKIGGTLVLPQNNGSGTLMIMVSGSGAQDRDETIVGFKPFKQIADSLAESGIASFRYDDRGVGTSSGVFDDAILEDLVSDLNAVISYFNANPDYNFEEILVLGHSQGGIVGVKAAAENPDIDKLILMASPSVPIKDVISEQVRINQEWLGKPEELIEMTLDFQEQFYEAMRTNTGWDSLEIAYTRLVYQELTRLPNVTDEMVAQADAYAKIAYQRQVEPIKTAQMRSLLHYDPAKDLAKLDIPVFAIFGGLDKQVTVDQNYGVFNEVCAAQNMDCTTQIINSANHLFQKAKNGMPAEYPALSKEFAEGFLSDIREWILEY